jgi:hypothetical protein
VYRPIAHGIARAGAQKAATLTTHLSFVTVPIVRIVQGKNPYLSYGI